MGKSSLDWWEKLAKETQGTKETIIIKIIVRRGNIYLLKEGNTMKQKGRVCKGKAKLSAKHKRGKGRRVKGWTRVFRPKSKQSLFLHSNHFVGRKSQSP